MKKRWVLVAILFLGLIIVVWRFLAKEDKVPVKEDPGIEISGVSERIVVYGEKEELEKWPNNLYNNIGEFNILVAGEFFILFTNQENNNEIDEIRKSIYSQIERCEKVLPEESFVIFFTQGKSNESWILRTSVEYGQGKISQRPVVIYYFELTHNRPPLNLKNVKMDHDKPYKTIDVKPLACYIDDVLKTIEEKDLRPYAEKIAQEFWEKIKHPRPKE